MNHKKDFTHYRWVNLLNTFLQTVLVVLLFGGAMHIASKFFWRSDLTQNHRYSLSAETLSYLENLDKPIRVIVTIASEGAMDEMEQLYRDVRGLLREYEYAARTNPDATFEVEFVNIYQQRKKAQLIASEYGVQQENLIIFASQDRQRIIEPYEIYESKDRKRKSFRGEQVFTSALLDVASDQQRTIYFITGHGVKRVDDTDPVNGLSELGDALSHRNFQLRPLDLRETGRVPEDADLVILAAPRTPLFSHEEEILRRYLSNDAGRLIVMIDPGRRHGLGELFYEWGVLVDDVLILDQDQGTLAGGGDMILRGYAEHPITQSLLDNDLVLVSGLIRSVREDMGRPFDDSLSLQPLIFSSRTSWGERAYGTPDENWTYTPGTDLMGPLSIAMVSERQLPSQLGINIPGGRLIVFGTSDFVSNNRIVRVPGNLTLFLNTANWMVDRDNMINIPPRPTESIELVLTRENINHLRLTFLGLLPGVVALSGIIVYWIRRK